MTATKTELAENSQLQPVHLENIYLWAAAFADGTQIVQDHTDLSRTHTPTPDDPGPKNQYYDVIQKQNESPLVSFVFYRTELNAAGQPTPVSAWGVDLRDGHFEHNGVTFWLHRPEHGEHFTEFRLIQFRHVVQTQTRPANDPSATPTNDAYIEAYILGWQANDRKGNNVQKTVKIVG